MARTRRSESTADNVRMGPLAVFTLMVVICLAVLAVLAIATANATLALSERRATATTEAYLDETAAQTFVATLDAGLAGGADVEGALEAARTEALGAASAESATGLAITASLADDCCTATFDCGNGRQLNITLRLAATGIEAVDEWRMTTVTNDEPAMGNLLGSL